MDSVFRAIGRMCAAAYVAGIFASFAKDGISKRIASLILALCILSAFISPSKIENVDFFEQSYENSTEQIAVQRNRYVLESAEKIIEDKLCRALDEKNISYRQVKAHINNQDEKIFVDEITVYGRPEEQRNEAGKIAKNLSDGCKVNFGD